MKRVVLAGLVSALAVACGRDPAEDDAKKLLTVDPDLTLSTFFGGDVGLAVAYDCDVVAGPVTATARGVTLATVATPNILQFESGNRFLVTIPAAQFDNPSFGNPSVVPITIAADCDGRPVISQPYAVTYVHPVRSGLAPAGANRVWSADVANEILACSGTELVRYNLEPLASPAVPPTRIESYPVGFACTLGEMRGDVGGRRYFTVDNGGIAAIDVGPGVIWSRSDILFEGIAATADADPVVSYRTAGSGTTQVRVLDAATGVGLTDDPLPLVNSALGPVARDASGTVLVLTRSISGVESTYWVERFDATGVVIGEPLRVARYGREESSNPDLPTAEFSFDGTKLYFSGNNDGDDLVTQWVSQFTIADATVQQLTTAASGYRSVLGEAYGRLLVASEDNLIWVDPATASLASQPFSPDSGRRFFRLRVGPDGSTTILGDPAGNTGTGFYVFAADGTVLARIHDNDTSFGWLTGGPDGGTLLVVLDPSGNEVHDLGPASGFVAAP